MEEDTQTQGAQIATQMTENLKTFTDEADKDQIGKIGNKVMGGLSGLVRGSTPDDSFLREDKMAGKEPNFAKLDEKDQTPKEDEYLRKLGRLKNRGEIKAKSATAKNVTQSSLKAVTDVAGAISQKQMMDEPAGEVKSGNLGISTEKVNKEDLAGKTLKNAAGIGIRMPKKIAKVETVTVAQDESSALGAVDNIEDEEVEVQMSTFDENPLKYGDDAALMNSPVTVLAMPNGTEGLALNLENNF